MNPLSLTHSPVHCQPPPRMADCCSLACFVRSKSFVPPYSRLSMVPYSNATPATTTTTTTSTRSAPGRDTARHVNVIITTPAATTTSKTYPDRDRLMTSDTVPVRPYSFAYSSRRSPPTTTSAPLSSSASASPPPTQWRTLLVLLSVVVFTFFVILSYTADMPVFLTFQIYSPSSTSISTSSFSRNSQQQQQKQNAFDPHCVHLLSPNAPSNDWKPFNSRSFCVYPRMCFAPRQAVRHTPTLFLPFYNETQTAESHDDVKPVSKCVLTTANFSLDANDRLMKRFRENDVDVCRNVEQSVWCAHGTYNQSYYFGICPNIAYTLPSSDHSGVRSSTGSTRRDDVSVHGNESSVTIVLPPLKHLPNIFHFAQAVVPLFQMAVNLPSVLPQLRLSTTNDDTNKKDVILLFRGEHPRMFCVWATSLLDAFIQHRLLLSDARFPTWIRSVSIQSTYENAWFHRQYYRNYDLVKYFTNNDLQKSLQHSESGPYCTAGTTVLMGERLNINNWMFPNHDNHNDYTWPFKMTNGSVSYGVNESVPLEALVFRRVLYTQASIKKTSLPQNLLLSGRLGYTPPQKLLLDLPPLTLSYARRNNGSDPLPGETHPAHGPVRRFSDADEHWFESMLRSIATKHNLNYTRLQPTAGMSLATQTRMFRDSGVIVGLHGANLLNAASAPAFSVLAEIANHETRCYVNGGNAGLAFMSYRPIRAPEEEESLCPKEGELGFLCRLHKAWRPVSVKDERDRRVIEEMVEHGVTHVKRLHDRFGSIGGVPVVYDAAKAVYSIDWKHGRR